MGFIRWEGCSAPLCAPSSLPKLFHEPRSSSSCLWMPESLILLLGLLIKGGAQVAAVGTSIWEGECNATSLGNSSALFALPLGKLGFPRMLLQTGVGPGRPLLRHVLRIVRALPLAGHDGPACRTG